jgi:hypothetical protein
MLADQGERGQMMASTNSLLRSQDQLCGPDLLWKSKLYKILKLNNISAKKYIKHTC